MMINVSTIESKFLRGNLKSHETYLWRDATTTLKDKVIAKINLLNNESIVLFFYHSETKFFILTNTRIITVTGAFFFRDIIKVGLSEIIENPGTKTDGAILDITTINNTKVNFDVEVGTWHVIYKILRFLIIKERKGLSGTL